MEKPEMMLKKLRRLEANMRCPNCGTPAPPGIGFGNVCIKFKTFICDLCKTSHQAISHRVKSFSMSTWTMEEVMDLTAERSGGNQAALHVWLAHAPGFGERYPGGFRPKEGDKVEIFKQFVTDCYEYGKFKSVTPFVPPTVSHQNSHATPQKKRVDERSAVPVAQPTQTPTRRTVAPVSEELDLLAFDTPEVATFSRPSDFGAFHSQPADQIDFFAQSTELPIVKSNGSFDLMTDFGDFSISVPQTTPPPDPFFQMASTSATTGISYSQTNGQNAFYGKNHSSLVDPFTSTIHSSASTPNFPSMAPQAAFMTNGNMQAQTSHIRPKSALDLASLYDQQPAQSNAASNAISSLNGSSGNGMIGGMYGSRPGQVQSSSGSGQPANKIPQFMQMGVNNGNSASNMMGASTINGSNLNNMASGNGNMMNGNGSMMNGNGNTMNGNGSMTNGNGSMMNGNGSMMNGNGSMMNGNGNMMNGNGNMARNGQMQNSGMGWNSQNSTPAPQLNSGVGMGYQPQQQQQQPYQQQSSQQQPYQHQPYRGMVTTSTAPKGPVDAFDFVGTALKSSYTATNGQSSGSMGTGRR